MQRDGFGRMYQERARIQNVPRETRAAQLIGLHTAEIDLVAPVCPVGKSEEDVYAGPTRERLRRNTLERMEELARAL